MGQAERIRILVSLMRGMSRNPDPDAIVRMVSGAMRKAYGPWAVILLSVRHMAPEYYLVTRLINHDGHEVITGMDPWYGDPTRPPQHGGLLGRLIREGEPRLLGSIDIGEDPALGDALCGYHSIITVPVYEAGEIVNWMVLAHPDSGGFREVDLEWGIMRANMVGAMINQQFANRQLQNATAQLQHEVDNIAALQRALLPPEPGPGWGLGIASYWKTYDRAGGDYYDYIPLIAEDGHARLLLFISDASGHGPSSAVIIAMLHIILRSLQESAQPSLILEEINTRLFEQRISHMFVTAWLGIYDPANRKLSYASAGHPPPLLRNTADTVNLLTSSSGIPLGVDDLVAADDRSIILEPGTTLVLYTDGITEARAPDREQFGIVRLNRAVAAADGDASTFCKQLLAAVDAHESGTRPDDDKCLLVIRQSR